MQIFIGMETSGALRRRFAEQGHDVISCDTLEAEDGGEIGRHIVGDVFEALEELWGAGWWPDLAIFHPTCTYLTNSAAWAFNDPDFDRYPGVGYHQKVKPGTLVGAERRQAREEALNDVRRILALPIMVKVWENPIGAISSAIMKPTQIVQPYEFGDDASKATCLWMVDKDGNELPGMRLPVDPVKYVPPTPRANGKAYWANQTDTGQNRLTQSDDRWKDRSRTFPGIADAAAAWWGKIGAKSDTVYVTSRQADLFEVAPSSHD